MFTKPLPIVRYRFTARAQQPLPLPNYAGSLLRGQFGAALRQVACMTRQPTCAGCPLIATCPYTRIFETPAPPKGSHALQDFSQIPKPYLVEPPTPGARVLEVGDTLQFHLVLIGHAIDQLALIVFAVQRALQHGLTRERVPLDLLQVDWVEDADHAQRIWHAEQPTLAEHTANLVTPGWASNGPQNDSFSIAPTADSTIATGQNEAQITLNIQTPLRLQNQGQPLGIGQLTPRALVAALARRVSLLMTFHAGQNDWDEAARHITFLSDQLSDTQDLHWFDWTRYSSRQRQEMTLGGVLGRWTLRCTPEVVGQIYPWLWLGQWLHVGKNAVMGMGGYRLATV